MISSTATGTSCGPWHIGCRRRGLLRQMISWLHRAHTTKICSTYSGLFLLSISNIVIVNWSNGLADVRCRSWSFCRCCCPLLRWWTILCLILGWGQLSEHLLLILLLLLLSGHHNWISWRIPLLRRVLLHLVARRRNRFWWLDQMIAIAPACSSQCMRTHLVKARWVLRLRKSGLLHLMMIGLLLLIGVRHLLLLVVLLPDGSSRCRATMHVDDLLDIDRCCRACINLSWLLQLLRRLRRVLLWGLSWVMHLCRCLERWELACTISILVGQSIQNHLAVVRAAEFSFSNVESWLRLKLSLACKEHFLLLSLRLLSATFTFLPINYEHSWRRLNASLVFYLSINDLFILFLLLLLLIIWHLALFLIDFQSFVGYVKRGSIASSLFE